MSDSLVDSLVEMLFGLAARGPLLIFAGAALAVLLHRAPPATRHLAWLTTSFALLALPTVGTLNLELELALLPPAEASADPAARIEGGWSAAASGSARSGMARPSLPATATWGTTARRGLGIVWLAGVVVLSTRLLVGVHRVRRITRRASPWRREGRVSILLSDEVATPMTWGSRRPVILMPGSARDWPRAEQLHALHHELAHVARRDWEARLLTRLSCVVHWFNPLVWWLERRSLLEAERAADDRVLLQGFDPRAYAAQLLRLATAIQRPSPGLSVPLARPRQLAQRIQSILEPNHRRRNMTKGSRLLAAAPLFLVLACVATIHITRAEARTQRVDDDAVVDARRTSPLVEAAAIGDLETAVWLLDAGFDPDRGVAGDGTPLIVAAKRGDLELTRRLLAAGADVEAAMPGDGNPLIAAAAAGHLEIVRILVENGAVLDRVVSGDENALIQASAAGHLEIVRFLVEQGADPYAEVLANGTEIRTALNQARLNGHSQVAAYLRSVGARD